MAVRFLKLPSGPPAAYEWPWDGRQKLRGTASRPVAFDTETEAIDRSKPYSVPRLALATAASASGACVVRPEDLARWVLAHADQHLVCHNAVFDFWVVDEHLAGLSRRLVSAEQARAAWRKIVTDGRLHDTMILDQLLRLGAEGPREIPRRSIEAVCQSVRLNLGIDKADPYRLRYGELIGADWSRAEAGFWDYAVRDAVATYRLWPRLWSKAEALRKRVEALGGKLIAKGAWAAYGPLTESLQVRGACALWDAGRNGLRVDLPSARRFVDGLRNELTLDVAVVRAWNPDVFLHVDECGKNGAPKRSVFGQPLLPGFEREIAVTKRGRAPRFKKAALTAALVAAHREVSRPSEKPPQAPGVTGGVSLAAKDWKPVAAQHGGVKAWLGLKKRIKTLGYAEPLVESPELHPTYNPLLVTGRAATRKPSIQQIPRSEDFRAIFRARAGHKLLTIDYAAIELCTLAAICEQRYGKSVLAQVIRDRRDPHSYTASMISGVTYEEIYEWVNLPDDDPRRSDARFKLYKGYRQSSKAIGFGTPGGLGPKKLAAYAQDTYGVAMTVDQARDLRSKLITEVYPELERYLRDTLLTDLAWNLGLPTADVCGSAKRVAAGRGRYFMRHVSDLVEGDVEAAITLASDATSKLVPKAWRWLGEVTAKSPLAPAWVRKQVRERRGSEALWRALFAGVAVTPTGRVRAGCTYSQAKNCPFQGLAADGAKLALWAIVAAGHRVVGFLHDEILVEVPEADAERALAEVSKLMVGSMDSVLMGVPSAVSAKAADHWLK